MVWERIRGQIFIVGYSILERNLPRPQRKKEKVYRNIPQDAYYFKRGMSCKGINEMPDSERMAIESIRYWLNNRQSYPATYNEFFIQWMLFNSYYSKYKVGDKKGVMKFGKEHGDTMWENGSLTDVARQISEFECVGEGRGENPPQLEVKSATVFLRTLFSIEHDRICSEVCREVKRRECSNLRFGSWTGNPASALLLIVYQVRCNLFHGDKIESTPNERERNLFLVKSGIQVLDEVLKHISLIRLIP